MKFPALFCILGRITFGEMIMDKIIKKFRNIGILDRIIRILVGAGLYVLGFVVTNAWEYLAILSPFLLLSAVIGISPFYLLLGISTRKQK